MMRGVLVCAVVILLHCIHTSAIPLRLKQTVAPPAPATAHYGPEAYDAFSSVVGRVGDNAQAEERYLRTNLMETRASCRHDLHKLKHAFEEHQHILTAANKTMQLNQQKAESARAKSQRLEPIIEEKKRMLKNLEMDINSGDVQMKLAQEVAHNKTQDAHVVISAVKALFSLLSAMNGSPGVPAASKQHTFMFREKLQDAQKHIKDPHVMRFLEATLSSLGSATSTPDGADLAKLQLLLSLLRSQMKDYVDSVKANIKVDKDNWDTQIIEMDQQRTLLKTEITERSKRLEQLKSRADLADQAAAASNATLNGPKAEEIQLISDQLNLTRTDCRRKLHHIKEALIAVQQQLRVTSVVGDMQFSPDDNQLLGRLSANVAPPKATLVDASGKRCCVMCPASKGRKACGDKCVDRTDTCRTVEGCACTDRD
jgi:hypothetical protein